MDSTKELQDRWANGQLIGLDIICDGLGFVKNIEIECTENNELVHAFCKEYSLLYQSETTLGERLGDYEDVWADVQIYNRLLLGDGRVVLCGEGEMGNEGFIAVVDVNNKVEWFMFSTESNPFVNIKQVGDWVYVQSTHNFCVVFGLVKGDASIFNGDFSALGTC